MHSSTYTTHVERLEAASAAWLRDLEEPGRLSRTVEAYASTLADFTSFFGADEDKPDIPGQSGTPRLQGADNRSVPASAPRLLRLGVRAWLVSGKSSLEASDPNGERPAAGGICHAPRLATPAALYIRTSPKRQGRHLPTELRNRDFASYHRPVQWGTAAPDPG